MVPQAIWVICAQVSRSTVGRIAVDAIVKLFPLLTRRTAVAYFSKSPSQAVLVIRQMARIFRNNATRSTRSVASEAVSPFKGILANIDETTAVEFFTELWETICKNPQVLGSILKF